MAGFSPRSQVLLAAVVTLVVTGVAHGQSTLVWSDEFNGSSLDPGNWEPMIGNGCEYGICGWGNNEREYYTARPENLFVSGGYLHIVAREESYQGFDYTSARIRTLNRQEFLYGRFEARIRLPQGGQGIWPAFWMLPTGSPYGGWAAGGEIDILEAIGVPLTVHGTLHYGGTWPGNVSSGGSYATGVSFGDDFHVYAIEWTADEMRWFVDGVHFHTETSSTWYSDAAPGNERAPFDSPFHFLLNLAVGGNWPGQPDATTPFPQEMLVDWVRVYDGSNEPPSVSIDSPADGAELPVGTVLIEASATDSDGSIERVEFYVNDALIDQDASPPYATSWAATDGCHRLQAVAVDDQGWTGSDEIAVKVGTACAGEPFHGAPVAIPGIVELEDFDLGGEGVAYHDCDSANNGGAYRPSESVDIQPASVGGFNVGWMCAGEWLDHTVDVTQGGYHVVEARVASQNTGGAFVLEMDGVDVTGIIDVPVTGGWQTWTTVTATVELSAGVQEMRFVNQAGTGEFNIDRLTFTHFADHDYDFDGDVDLDDLQSFVPCATGPGSSAFAGPCTADHFAHSDVDDDNDVDLIDFAVFQAAFTTP